MQLDALVGVKAMRRSGRGRDRWPKSVGELSRDREFFHWRHRDLRPRVRDAHVLALSQSLSFAADGLDLAIDPLFFPELAQARVEAVILLYQLAIDDPFVLKIDHVRHGRGYDRFGA